MTAVVSAAPEAADLAICRDIELSFHADSSRLHATAPRIVRTGQRRWRERNDYGRFPPLRRWRSTDWSRIPLGGPTPDDLIADAVRSANASSRRPVGCLVAGIVLCSGCPARITADSPEHAPAPHNIAAPPGISILVLEEDDDGRAENIAQTVLATSNGVATGRRETILGRATQVTDRASNTRHVVVHKIRHRQ